MRKLLLAAIAMIIISALSFGNDKPTLQNENIPANSLGLVLSTVSHECDYDITDVGLRNVQYGPIGPYLEITANWDATYSIYASTTSTGIVDCTWWTNASTIYVSITSGSYYASMTNYDSHLAWATLDSPFPCASSYHSATIEGTTYTYNLSTSL